MRILLTTHAFLPRSVAGVEVYTARLAAALRELGHTVAVLTAGHDLSRATGSERRFAAAGCEVFEVNDTHERGTLAATCGASEIDRAVAHVLTVFRPDVVHAQHLMNLSLSLVDSARAQNAPFIWTLHDYWLGCPRDGLRLRADGTLCEKVEHGLCARCLDDSPYLVPGAQAGAMRMARRLGLGGLLHRLHRSLPRLTTSAMRLLRRLGSAREDRLRALDDRRARLARSIGQAAAVIAPTRFAAERAREWGVPAGILRVVPLGAVADGGRSRRGGPRRRLGYVGTVAPHKGIHVLIEALRSMAASEWSLDVFGNARLDPPYERRLMRLAGVDPRIRFRGPMAVENQPQMWAALDALVLPSLWWENSPLCLLEALAAGLPVVASRIGGIPEVVPAGGGVLVPPGDVSALRDTLAAVVEGRLLAEPADAFPLTTTIQGARELEALYAAVRA